MRASAVRIAAASLIVTAAGTMPSATAAPFDDVSISGHAKPAVVDPALTAQLATGPAPALLSWDEDVASRNEIAGYLRENEIPAQVFARLPGAVVCAASSSTIPVLAQAPGAVSVWGDHPLRVARTDSIETVLNGSAASVTEDLGVTGEGVGIAVVDTGVDGTHPDLQYGIKTKLNVRVLLSHMDLLGPNGDPCIADQITDQLEDSELTSGHGTHLAGVAAGDGTASGGYYSGVAPGSDVVGVGVADTVTPQAKVEDRGAEVSLLGAIAGTNYVLLRAIEDEVRVKVLLAGWTQDGLYDPWHPMAWAIRGAFEDGVSVVLPVGNEGPGVSNCSNAESCAFNPWAADPRAIGVAAMPPGSKAALQSYSSRGDPEERQARNQLVRYEPTLSAPGGAIAARRPGLAPYVTAPGSILAGGSDGKPVLFDRRYVGMAGTSVAAAHVAGAVALMQEAAVAAKGCYLTTTQVKELLATTATPMDGYGTWEAGAGALDVAGAVAAARAEPMVWSRNPWMCPGEGER